MCIWLEKIVIIIAASEAFFHLLFSFFFCNQQELQEAHNAKKNATIIIIISPFIQNNKPFTLETDFKPIFNDEIHPWYFSEFHESTIYSRIRLKH